MPRRFATWKELYAVLHGWAQGRATVAAFDTVVRMRPTRSAPSVVAAELVTAPSIAIAHVRCTPRHIYTCSRGSDRVVVWNDDGSERLGEVVCAAAVTVLDLVPWAVAALPAALARPLAQGLSDAAPVLAVGLANGGFELYALTADDCHHLVISGPGPGPGVGRPLAALAVADGHVVGATADHRLAVWALDQGAPAVALTLACQDQDGTGDAGPVAVACDARPIVLMRGARGRRAYRLHALVAFATPAWQPRRHDAICCQVRRVCGIIRGGLTRRRPPQTAGAGHGD